MFDPHGIFGSPANSLPNPVTVLGSQLQHPEDEHVQGPRE
jgi:hypothetical protein